MPYCGKGNDVIDTDSCKVMRVSLMMLNKIMMVIEKIDVYSIADVTAEENQKLEHLEIDLLFKLNQKLLEESCKYHIPFKFFQHINEF